MTLPPERRIGLSYSIFIGCKDNAKRGKILKSRLGDYTMLTV
jgi:hypothetical protein